MTLFYYDTQLVNTTNKAGKITYSTIGPGDPRRWKLLFMGEVVAISFQKQDSQRAAVIQCMDFTTYWDAIKQHYVNFSNGGVELFENAFLGVNMDRLKFYDVITTDVQSRLLTMLLKSTVPVFNKNKTTTKVTGMSSELVYEVDSVGNSILKGKRQVKDTVTTVTPGYEEAPSLYLGAHRVLREMWFSASNFYARAYNRLRIGDTLVGLKGDTTSARLFRLQYFQKFIQNQIGGGGSMVSVREMMGLLLGTVKHTYVTVPCPMFDPTGDSRGFNPDADKDTISKAIINRKAYAGATLNYTIIKPDTWFLVPPACNIILPHQYNSIAYQRNYLAEPTRLFMRTNLFFGGNNDKWMTERFYAPDFEVFNSHLYASGGYLRRLSEILLPHEQMVGINAIMGWEPDVGAYVAKGARREYLSKLADLEFWKMRFSQRNLNVTMPFNSNPVPGYTGVVMDRVGVGDDAGRHFIGHIAVVVHSIDQSGGWTYITMTGARVHDEDIDFDGKGRSIEEITSRGADGFLDDRYDPALIGKDVYTPLLGCGSLTDVVGSADSTNYVALSETYGPVIAAVAELEQLYRKVLSANADPEVFAQSLTRRPKADIVQIMGANFAGDDSTRGIEALINDPAFQGFMGVAVDPGCLDIQKGNDAYVVQVPTTSYVKVTTAPVMSTVSVYKMPDGSYVSKADEGGTGNPYEQVLSYQVIKELPTTTTVSKTTYSAKSTGSYGLKEHLEERQKPVKAYADSLKLRGLRG